MVYIRIKKVKGIEYAYLVQSTWDEKLKTSKQETIKYLGKASDISVDNIPKEYQSTPKILTFLANHNIANKKSLQKEHARIQKILFDLLTNGDLDGTVSTYDTYSKSLHLSGFYDHILREVMYTIGHLWERKKLGVAQEHVASNTAHSFVKTLTERIPSSSHGPSVIICTPEGEWHNLGCSVLESVLRNKGFRIFNISPSLPHDSIVNYIEGINPAIVFISVTLSENISSCRRLINKIGLKSSVPIVVGGLAIKEKENLKLDAIISKDNLENIPILVKNTIKHVKKDRINSKRK